MDSIVTKYRKIILWMTSVIHGLFFKFYRVPENQQFFYWFKKIIQLPKLIADRKSVERNFRKCLTSLPIINKNRIPFSDYEYNKTHQPYLTGSGESNLDSLILEFVYGKGRSMELKKDDFGLSQDRYGTMKVSGVLGLGNYFIDIYRIGENDYYKLILYDL